MQKWSENCAEVCPLVVANHAFVVFLNLPDLLFIQVVRWYLEVVFKYFVVFDVTSRAISEVYAALMVTKDYVCSDLRKRAT